MSRVIFTARPAVAMLMEGYWGMGSSIGSHMASKASIGSRGQFGTMETGQDRNMLETELGRRVEGKLRELFDRAEALVKENRHEILAVAHTLETHKTVTGEDVIAIIEGRQGPLIDGRPYASKDFAKLTEAYHKAALAAHRTKEKVPIPLPVVTGGFTPQAVAVSPQTDEGSAT